MTRFGLRKLGSALLAGPAPAPVNPLADEVFQQDCDDDRRTGGTRQGREMMNHLVKSAVALMATAALGACGTNNGSDQNAANDMAASSEVNAGAPAATDPFASAEQQMSDKMMASVGSNAGQSWAGKMIAHHQGAIDMSKIVLEQNPTADVAAMARENMDKQAKDIDSIRKLLKSGAPDQKSADLYRPAMMDMQQAMMAASGANASETYLRKMLAHHKGAVAMSDVALHNGVSGALKTQVEKTKMENQKDAAMVEAMLSGKPMSAMKDHSQASGKKDMTGMDMNHMDMNNMDMNHM